MLNMAEFMGNSTGRIGFGEIEGMVGEEGEERENDDSSGNTSSSKSRTKLIQTSERAKQY